MTDPLSAHRSTEAAFVPDRRKGLAKPSAVEWMAILTGIALCSTGVWGIAIGVPIALAALYSGFFLPPKVARGLYFGACPCCGAQMSATHYQESLGCPSCEAEIRVRDSRFEAIAAPE